MPKSKIKINPVTMEIEIEVADAFLEKYFRKLTSRLSRGKKVQPKITAIKTADAPAAKAQKVARRARGKAKPKARKMTSEQAVRGAIKKGREQGVSVAQVAEATRLERRLVRERVNALKAKGLITTVERGRYIGIEYAEGEAWVLPPDMEE